ncbi:MAG: Fe2+-dependent dioxygenase [Gammaproteobacteria bacterium]
MFKVFDKVLTPVELQRVQSLLASATFESGAATAGPAARNVKNNLQATATQQGLDEARAVVMGALAKNEAFRDHAFPLRMVPPVFSRYEPGMRYGEHTDNAVMGNVRTDLALTVFLSPPESYDGGELIVDVDRDPRSIKLAAGCAVVYLATSLHRVEPVTRGRRSAAVTWIQSMVRDAAQREVLADLGVTLRFIRAGAPNTRETLSLAKARANLLRMWAEL